MARSAAAHQTPFIFLLHNARRVNPSFLSLGCPFFSVCQKITVSTYMHTHQVQFEENLQPAETFFLDAQTFPGPNNDVAKSTIIPSPPFPSKKMPKSLAKMVRRVENIVEVVH